MTECTAQHTALRSDESYETFFAPFAENRKAWNGVNLRIARVRAEPPNCCDTHYNIRGDSGEGKNNKKAHIQ